MSESTDLSDRHGPSDDPPTASGDEPSGERAASRDEPVRLLFVCLGNICRSPTAEAVMAAKVEAAGLADVVEIDSAGVGGWHVGDPPDDRARAEARRRGLEMTSRARQLHAGDFEYFDLIVAMDAQNLQDIADIAPSHAHLEKVYLLRRFDPASDGAAHLDVPDPYYGGPDGFADVFDLVDAACRGLLEHLRANYL
jgi:protein-tyrosine phosphatase